MGVVVPEYGVTRCVCMGDDAKGSVAKGEHDTVAYY